MSGRIIFQPSRPTACERGACEGKPKAEAYRDGTVWQCDECGSKWEVWSGAQYNEAFSAWRRTGEPIPGWGTDRPIGRPVGGLDNGL